MSSKKKAEQRKEFREYLSIADKRVLDIKASGIELIADDEVFVLVNGTNNYWISNHGRMTNNLHGKFYMHKTDCACGGIGQTAGIHTVYYSGMLFCDSRKNIFCFFKIFCFLLELVV